MQSKRIIVTALVLAVFALLIVLQFRHFRAFNWETFINETSQAKPLNIVFGIALLYIVYVLRALRWKIMLRPVYKTTTMNLVPATFIGFTGMALLGRAGDFTRPYLIARKLRMSFSSQMGVWAVERIFDTASFTLLIAANIIWAPSLRGLPFFRQFERAGFVLLGAVFVVAALAVVVRKNGTAAAKKVERILGVISKKIALSVANRIRAFGNGLNTIHDASSLLQLIGLSVVIWLLISLSYFEVTHAYPEPLRSMTISHVILLMGFSIAGSIVQLPVVGGGAQLLTIGALAHVFEVPQELAVSCGILLWLVTFVAVTPVGMLLARREHLSWKKLSEASHEVEVSTL